MTEIAQCPYCPADLNPVVRLREDAGIMWVACGRCGARGPMYISTTSAADHEEFKTKAIHAWNTVANLAASTKDMVPMALEAQETIETLRNEVKFLRDWRESMDQLVYRLHQAIALWRGIANPAATISGLEESIKAAIKDAIKYQTILKKYGKTFKSLFDEVENNG